MCLNIFSPYYLLILFIGLNVFQSILIQKQIKISRDSRDLMLKSGN